jgi:hypothetical protein
MSYGPNDPPPNNAGFARGGSTGFPKKKTLEFERLTFSYDYTSRSFTIEDGDSYKMEFGETELIELRAAMTTFGIGNSNGVDTFGNPVTYR